MTTDETKSTSASTVVDAVQQTQAQGSASAAMPIPLEEAKANSVATSTPQTTTTTSSEAPEAAQPNTATASTAQATATTSETPKTTQPIQVPSTTPSEEPKPTQHNFASAPTQSEAAQPNTAATSAPQATATPSEATKPIQPNTVTASATTENTAPSEASNTAIANSVEASIPPANATPSEASRPTQPSSAEASVPPATVTTLEVSKATLANSAEETVTTTPLEASKPNQAIQSHANPSEVLKAAQANSVSQASSKIFMSTREAQTAKPANLPDFGQSSASTTRSDLYSQPRSPEKVSQKSSGTYQSFLNKNELTQQKPIDLIKSALHKCNIDIVSVSPRYLYEFTKWYFSPQQIHDGLMRYQQAKANAHELAQKRSRESAQMLLNELPLSFPNGSKGKPYNHSVKLPPQLAQSSDIDIDPRPAGLTAHFNRISGELTLQGTPTEAKTFACKLRVKPKLGQATAPILERQFSIIINPNINDLWVSKPVPTGIPFPKPDEACEFVPLDGLATKTVVAASKRGRSHAQEGKPRDDDFCVQYYPENNGENGWYLLAVADGAGSAQYSREGSRLACEVVEAYCQEQLHTQGDEFAKNIKAYATSKAQTDLTCVTEKIHAILFKAAVKAHEKLVATAKANEGAVLKDFSTTLLLTICRKFEFGWFFASFGVGDGAIAIYDKNSSAIKLLNDPDSGEYAGQTRFLTMESIFTDKTRIKMSIVEDFTALILMTDGISDPFFDTEANLSNKEKWDNLWQRLSKEVNFNEKPEDVTKQLLGWLDFMERGHHDDRTIAILY